MEEVDEQTPLLKMLQNKNLNHKYSLFVKELGFHYSLHTSLDVIEEKLNNSNKSNDQR